ncbi:hypothetical protein B0H13DRAFT_1901357 [Mycena leptocephala]|nr:hypothetical protein B0H13DRAFT_1901357 [Mycena leptocephala]
MQCARRHALCCIGFPYRILYKIDEKSRLTPANTLQRTRLPVNPSSRHPIKKDRPHPRFSAPLSHACTASSACQHASPTIRALPSPAPTDLPKKAIHSKNLIVALVLVVQLPLLLITLIRTVFSSGTTTAAPAAVSLAR